MWFLWDAVIAYAGSVPVYRAICEEIAADGYRGFRMSPKSEPAPSVTA
jgi:hypothetical protein